MNNHFHDSLYYLKRAGQHAKLGVEAHLSPIPERVRRAVGSEPAPEPTRLESVRERVTEFRVNAGNRSRATSNAARTRASTERTDEPTTERTDEPTTER
ncbi:DUF7553 family protein [Natrarchaeobaculum sulfurireducens]|nr:hypothetical protein [Natrarchaeobaculum sulfurireducens]AXR82289.1 hypothetical protein AArcMg_2293 [Natrarchaeobaculum sulfurireducens]